MKQDWQNKTFINVKILGLYNFYSFTFSAFLNILKRKRHMHATSHLSLLFSFPFSASWFQIGRRTEEQGFWSPPGFKALVLSPGPSSTLTQL